ncbi:MAG TPA: glycogen debranching N-terminal domain-containing protein [Nocardioides sp.]|nr:glycogen debranching N-terminal domain-containing protein [Nocardioides sp.]
MTAPWLYAGAPDPRADGEVVLMEGTTFCISDASGDIGDQRASGLFVRDTRVLSRWALRLRGHRMDPLRIHQEAPYAGTFVLFAAARPGDTDVVVTRERFVGDGLREEITVRNAGAATTHVLLDLAVGADFADLFEVKEGREHEDQDLRTRAGPSVLDLSRERGGDEYAVCVEPAPGARIDQEGLHWRFDLGGHGTWRATVLVVPRLRGQPLTPLHPPGEPAERAEPARRHRQFRSSAPRLATADPDLAEVLAQSIDDLAVLRIFDPDHPDLPVIAAGAPWFMALFGRDSLITSTMLLPVDSSLALGTLTTLAAHAGTTVDPVTEEQPGRIPHEVRFGPAGTLALGGRNVYYGSADATPLFLVALGELLRWQPDLVGPDLVAAADRALAWMEADGDVDGDGFIEYHRATERGLVNQGWKDSWDGINHADGTIAESPIALAEVQAYAYAAYRARAEIADTLPGTGAASRWHERAERLRASFNEAFWLPERGWYAVGLDRDKRPIDALTSNNGHCLWAGIADDDKAAEVARHLLSPAMFSGWGIRTLASGMGAYNPMSYHNGSVWPHDTAICVAGLSRYGYAAEAGEVALGLLDAAASFQGRVPELFAGFTRADIPVPVPYPAACSPQAWAAAAPVHLLRTLLRLEPTADGLACVPAVPDRLLPLQLHHVPCRGQRYDVEVDHHGNSSVVSRSG